MRDKYVGDVGDYYKYALLRHLSDSRHGGLKLGVVWYLFADPCVANDGNHRSYLGKPQRFRYLDPELYNAMPSLDDSAPRSVHAVERKGILPGARFFSEPLSLSHLPKGNSAAIAERIRHRGAWLERALAATIAADLIFVDPDNGLEVSSTPIHRDAAPKFTFYRELRPFWSRSQSLVIYQHKNLRQTSAAQMAERMGNLMEELPGATIDAVYFPSGSGRMFFVAAQPHHAALLRDRLNSFRAKTDGHIRSFPVALPVAAE